jgi:putative redox protein
MAGDGGAAIFVSHVEGDRLRIETRGHELFTDQPIEDGGEDSAPTPTELFVAGLASCVAFYAERFLSRHGLSADGLKISCRYRWAEDPHRVGEIDLEVDAPGLSLQKREAFKRVIDHCTVHNSLLRPPAVRIAVSSNQVAVA